MFSLGIKDDPPCTYNHWYTYYFMFYCAAGKSDTPIVSEEEIQNKTKAIIFFYNNGQDLY